MGQQNSAEEKRKIIEAFRNNLYTDVVLQSSVLINQPFDVISLLLEYLEIEDLVNLSSVCKAMHLFVMEFLKHECHISRVKERLNKFLKDNRDLLTPWEKQCVDRIEMEFPRFSDQKNRVEDFSSKDRRMIWWLTKKKQRICGDVVRISTTDERVYFPHRGTNHIPIKQDAELDRRVCELNSVCWLHISTTFGDVRPGTYVCSLIMKVYRNARMPLGGNEVTEWILNCVNDNYKTGREFWEELSRQRTPRPQLCNGLQIELVDMSKADEEENWIALRLPPFRLEEKKDVVFEMKDIQCKWWKQGIDFDFVELRRL